MKFRLFGFPVEIHWTILVVALFIAGNMPTPALVLFGAVVIVVSVFVHELGHAVMARTQGLAPAIRLYYFGGVTSWRDTVGLSPRQRLAITLAGPGAGFLFAGLLYFGLPVNADWPMATRYLLALALTVNVVWGILNLLPMLPLDGGAALSEILTIVRGRPDRILVHRISTVTGAVLAILRGQFFLGIMLGYLAYSNYTSMRNLGGTYGGGWR